MTDGPTALVRMMTRQEIDRAERIATERTADEIFEMLVSTLRKGSPIRIAFAFSCLAPIGACSLGYLASGFVEDHLGLWLVLLIASLTIPTVLWFAAIRSIRQIRIVALARKMRNDMDAEAE